MAAQDLYKERLEFLREEVKRVSKTGQHLGKDYEAESMAAVGWTEDEVEGIDECLKLLTHLLRR